MSKNYFNELQRQLLEANTNVASVSPIKQAYL